MALDPVPVPVMPPMPDPPEDLPVIPEFPFIPERLDENRSIPPTPDPPELVGSTWPFLAGLFLLALGFQIHFSVNSATQYLKFAKPADLEWLMPLFWVGFSVLMMPGSSLCKRFGTLEVMGVSAVIGAAGAYLAASAVSLDTLIAAQLVAGGAWGSMLMCGFTAAMNAGPL